MRIVIDYQGAQSTGSRHRGIGRYTSAITQALIRQASGADIILLLNGAFAETIEPIRREFENVLPQEKIMLWQPLQPIGHIQAENDHRRRASELLREVFIARLNPDALIITSHFEGSGDNAATTVGLLQANYLTAIILYDLIPFIHRALYLSNEPVERWYEQRLGSMKRADLLLAISASSRQEAIDYLGYSPDRSVSIGTAADPHFRKIEISAIERSALYSRYGITKPFVMYTGGIDHRKNIEGLIRAYSKLPEAIRKKHQITIVCSLRNEDGPRLWRIAEEVGLQNTELLFTGFVPEDDLVALYNSCKLFVFPSWHEGFGLPALEAMWCGAPVIAANSSSLPEVLGDPAALFDPRQDASMTEKMELVLTDEKFRQRLIKNGLRRATMFSWDTIAERALVAIKGAIASKAEEHGSFLPNHRPRLAMVSPAPPAKSGIAYYTATLIRALQRFYQIDLVLRNDLTTDDPFILANCGIINELKFRELYSNYDRVIYQFGNSDHHDYMCNLLKDCPGLIVLHDFFVSDLSSWREHLGNAPGNWGIDLYESHGIGALLERHAEPDLFSIINKYPCSYATTRHAFGVLCHSQEAKQLQIHWHGREAAREWAVIPMIRAMPKFSSRSEARTALCFADEEFIVCAFGIIGESKLNHRLIEAWNISTLSQDKNCRLLFVGGSGSQDYYAELRAMIDGNSNAGRIEFTGWINETDYWRYLAAADVAVQLRGITHGETSAATLDAMLAGLPVIANDSPSLPEDANDAIALIPADASVADLAASLDRMIADLKWRGRMSKAAHSFAVLKHSESVCGRKFAEAVERSYLSSAHTLSEAVEQVEELVISELEAVSLAVEYAGLLNQQMTVYLDISGLMPSLTRSFPDFLQPLLLMLADRAPNIRLILIHRTEGSYVTSLGPILNAALFPHPDHSEEPILMKSIDRLVSFGAEDFDFAQGVARAAGARHLPLKEQANKAIPDVVDTILKFVESGLENLREIVVVAASDAPNVNVNGAVSLKAPYQRKARGKRKGMPGEVQDGKPS